MTMDTHRYSAVARWLHWIIALLVIWNVVSGLIHDALPRAQSIAVMGLHISSGITILALSLLRLAWRLGHRPPPLPAGMTGWQVGLAHGTHWAFYALMILLPLTGWAIVSTGPFPISWLGLATVPKLAISKDDALAEISGEGHEVLGILMGLLVLLHIGAALWHQFGVKDNLLARMR
jgi:cytochrome b561